VAWFWDQPLRAPLIRHGANLHGRYLLPHFLMQDIAEVAADLALSAAIEAALAALASASAFPR